MTGLRRGVDIAQDIDEIVDYSIAVQIRSAVSPR